MKSASDKMNILVAGCRGVMTTDKMLMAIKLGIPVIPPEHLDEFLAIPTKEMASSVKVVDKRPREWTTGSLKKQYNK